MNRLVWIGLFVFLICSCSSDAEDYSKWISDTKVRESPKMKPLPKFEVVPVFRLSKQDLRFSPFSSQRSESIEEDLELGRAKKTLHDFPLSSLKLVGTLEEGRKQWALIKQPDGEIRQLSIGDVMGREEALVVAIEGGLIQIKQSKNRKKHWLRIRGSEV